MSTARVTLWGRTIGAVSWDEERALGFFEYDKAFQNSGVQLSPIKMPLADRVYSFPALSRTTFHGLPGMLADSLPDKFGNALINAWLAREGRNEDSFNPVERLCYIGSRGMGALEYSPVKGPKDRTAKAIDVDMLVNLANDVLSNRGTFAVHLEAKQAVERILHVGTSAGGARAKAIIAWNEKTNEVRSGQLTAGKGFTYWLMKFDGIDENKDKEVFSDPRGYGLIEYAYYLMALESGINMMECRLFEENGRHHFMTKRFDRNEDGDKLHMQSLAAIEHFDFNNPGAYSYEQAMQTIKKLGLGMAAIEEQFRRMAFNIIARNQDDHVKNIAFLMNKRGEWILSPAYDMTYSYNPNGDWTNQHQMTLNGKRDGFNFADFKTCAKMISMKRGRAETIVQEVQEAVARWSDFADQAGVAPAQSSAIGKMFRRFA